MSEGPNKTLLLVEDDILTALAEKKALEDYGYAVIAVDSGERAVEAFRGGQRFDLILMDINLGKGMDGTEAAELIQRDYDVPIVFVSSHGEREVVEKTERITSYGYVVKNSGITVLDASIKMAFKLYDANRNVKLINDKLVAIFDALPDLLFEVGLDGYYFNIHSNHPDLLYGPASELIGRRIPEVLPPEIADILMSAIREAHEKGISTGKHYELAVPAGTRRFEISASRIEGSSERPRCIFLARDITDRKLAEEVLRTSESLHRSILQTTMDGYWLTDSRGRILDVNEAYCEMSGYAREELLGMAIPQIAIEESGGEVAERIVRVIARGDERFDSRHRRKDGRIIEVEVSIQFLPSEGDRVVSFFRDITERKQAERRISNLLAEKELILKEVHHRIKNNMNTMIGLLSLHARKIGDPEAAAAMKGAENQLYSMGLLYDRLYRSDNYREVNARDYFPSLVEEIVGIFPNRSVARVETDIDDFVIGVKALSTLGIIVNELVTNIMKYAFAGKAEGRIFVSAKRSAAGATLVVRDDGVGLPESVGKGVSTGFGLVLIEALTKQLNGSLKIEREGGTSFILDFEL